jgi:hypothetical protein
MRLTQPLIVDDPLILSFAELELRPRYTGAEVARMRTFRLSALLTHVATSPAIEVTPADARAFDWDAAIGAAA